MKTEQMWDDRFGPPEETSDGSTFFNTFGEEMGKVLSVDRSLVWAIFIGDIDDRDMFLKPGLDHEDDAIGYVIASRPITDLELSSGEWSEVVWVDSADWADERGVAGHQDKASFDPTDTPDSDLWFSSFGAILSEEEILGSGDDDPNSWSDQEQLRALISGNAISMKQVWTVVEDDDGNLRVSPGIRENAVNYLVATNQISAAELESKRWEDFLWYSAEPSATPPSLSM